MALLRRSLLLLLLFALSSAAAALSPRRLLGAEHAPEAGAKAVEAQAVKAAVAQAVAYDNVVLRDQRNRAATSGLFVGALVGGSAVYCVMKAGSSSFGGGAGGQAGGKGSGGSSGSASDEDLKQRLNRLKALQAASTAA
jgi:hypothetical protein